MILTHRAEVAANDGPRALEFAVRTLVGIGFRLERHSATAATLVGPGMNSSKQNPVVGASSVELSATSRGLVAQAELGGAQRMAGFVRWFPPTLAVGIYVVLSTVFLLTPGPARLAGPLIAALPCGIVAAVWLVLGPWVGAKIVGSTKQGLDNLVASAGQAAS
jgi:hypothetical protein